MGLVSRYKEYKSSYNEWLAQRSLPVETAIVTTTSGLQYAAIAGCWNILIEEALDLDLRTRPPKAFSIPWGYTPCLDSLFSSPLVHARNFGIWGGVNLGIYSAMKRLRAKEDFWTSMVAGTSSGVMLSFISGMGGRNVISLSALSTLYNFGTHKLGKRTSRQPPPAISQTNIHENKKHEEKFSEPEPLSADILYNKTRDMLSSLGLDYYEKNFKAGLLTDKTLPFLTQSELQEVKIPAGARLLILDYIKRDEEKRYEV